METFFFVKNVQSSAEPMNYEQNSPKINNTRKKAQVAASF